MKTHTLLCYLLLCLCVGTQAQIRGLKIADDNGNFTLAANEKRVALLIGNSQYEQQGRLKNPKNDATDMAAKLRNLGFDTQLVTDANRQNLVSAVRTFREKAKGSQTVALFFYAGHGVQVNGENYLVPVDADLQTELDVTTECYALSSLLNDLNNTALKVIILDACRDNPFQATQTTRAAIRVVWHKLRLPQAPTLRTLLHPAQRLPMAPKSETRPIRLHYLRQWTKQT